MAVHTMKPIIGVIMGYQPKTEAPTLHIGEAYLNAVIKAGGIPLLLPLGTTDETLSEMLDLCAGLIVTGGPDMDPLLYQDEPDARAGGVDPRRDAHESTVIKKAFKSNMPILGICRGIQSLNICFGGTLHGDLVDDVPGSDKHDFYPNLPRNAYRHTITINEGNLLHDVVGKDTIRVNSLHHQGIKDTAKNFIAVAYPEDGGIEAIVATDHPWCIGVQWHPECLPEDEDAQTLFSAYIQAANQFWQAK